jgi:hypothetical protein
MQSVDNIFEQALPTVIGFPSMPLSSMAMGRNFFVGHFAAQCVNDKFFKSANCINKSPADIAALQRRGPRPLRSRVFTAGITREYSCCVKYRQYCNEKTQCLIS